MCILFVFCLLMLCPVSEFLLKIYGVPLQSDLSPIKSHKWLLPLKDGDDREVSEIIAKGS